MIINFPDDRLKVHGLAWFEEEKPVVRRLPTRLKETFRAPVWNLAQCPAGGRIRFKTDSIHVGIEAKAPDDKVMNHITRIGQSGFDIYVDGYFMGSVSPDETGKISANWVIAKDKKLRAIEISMPLYKPVTIESVSVDDGSAIEDPPAFRIPKPVVYYGTSITQGGCASTPGTTYQSFISRWLNVDFVNLGFSGNGLGEPELATAVSEIDASCFVIDFWGNVTAEVFEQRLPGFVGPIRENHPETPVVITTPLFRTADYLDPYRHDKEKRDAQAFVNEHQKQGDRHIYLCDGDKMMNREQNFGLVDGSHPTPHGFYMLAQGLSPLIKKVLGI